MVNLKPSFYVQCKEYISILKKTKKNKKKKKKKKGKKGEKEKLINKHFIGV